MFAAPSIVNPSEILLLPTGHYLATNTVVTLTNDLPDQVIGDFDENFLNIIVAQSAITNTVVDGSHIAATNFVAIGMSGYYGAQVVVTNGTHTVTSSQPVGVEVYGFGYADAYGYFGGVVK
jgi:IgGFc binding protein